MSEFAKEVLTISLEDEMQQSYLEYAMSVIVGRALPDVRDGLKPVHRRVLYAMHELGNDWNKAYKKSARVVGDVIGKYHPHGDTAVYDTIVRMAQPFSMRYMIVDGQGNFGSVDGDAPAAMRYTEVRMNKIAHSMLQDLDKETVDFIPNYDETEHEPSVMPTRVPNLLINGSSGIAVGMATNVPPHNITEVLNACIALIDDSSMSIEDLMQYIPGPDFPTAGSINGASGIHEAYHTGKGRIYVRAKANFEDYDSGRRQRIVITELPYQVNKARLQEKIAELVREKKIEGITAIRDESDKDGMRLVIELRRGEVSEVVLNNLYKQTQMQNVFGINMVAIVNGRPSLLNLKAILEYFILHRREVVIRRSLFELRKARARAHTLEGLAIALANIEEVIKLIRSAATPSEAKAGLLERFWQSETVNAMLEKAGSDACKPQDLDASFGVSEQGYKLTESQAQAILDLKLHRLTGLEQHKILDEFTAIVEIITELLDILGNISRLMAVIREELVNIRSEFGDERRTIIMQKRLDLTLEDLITEEDVVVTLSHEGYAKAQTPDNYQAQKRGGKGKSATSTKNEDFIDQLFVANTHDTILCFSSRGRVYWLKVYELPQASRNARGRPIVNLLPLEPDERINAFLPVRSYDENLHVFMATSKGTVKKTSLTNFSRPRNGGIIAIDLKEDDQLVDVQITDGSKDIMLFTTAGKAIRFNEHDVRQMGRTAGGVRGVKLDEGQQVTSLVIVENQLSILTVSENGFGKRTAADQYPIRARGGKGVISIKTSDRNGQQVGAIQVSENDEIMLITDGGTLVRTHVADISEVSRSTQGVTLIRLTKGEKLIGIERIESLSDGSDDIDSTESFSDDHDEVDPTESLSDDHNEINPTEEND